MELKQIGFDIEERASVGKGKTISMKSGMCEGRNFAISEVRYNEGTDSWVLTCKRQQDDTLGMYFPNIPYEIKAGDEFVLLDIALPESYIRVAQERLLEEGQKLLARASKIQNHYEPSIDAKVMFESGRSLREGMFMEITDEDVVDNTTDYILIDTLNIYEDESAIPTYKVTLRERRKVTYKGTPSATSSNDTKPVEDTTKETTASSFESFWEEDENGNVFTSRQVRIKNNLIVDGDTASGGEGGNNEGGDTIVLDTVMSDISENGVQNKVIKAYVDLHPQYEVIESVENPGDIELPEIKGVKVNGTTYTDTDGDGFVDISDAFEGLEPDIDLAPYAKTDDVAKKYATKTELNDAISSIDLTPYATKQEVDKEIADLINGAPTTLDTLGEIATAFAESKDIVEALDKAIGQKANQSALDALSELVASFQTTLNNINSWYSRLNSLVVEENGNVRIKTNVIIDGDTSVN
jgi:hypothetical protein